MSFDVAGRRILLGVYDIANYAGAELHCLQLAQTFQENGAHVEVATFNYAYPIRSEYEKNGISVKNVIFDQLDYSEYDLLWLHHTMLTDYVLFQLGVSAAKIVYNSLSPFEPLDAVPPYGQYLSACFANSEETKQAMIAEGVPAGKIRVFPNYVTTEMLTRAKKNDNHLVRKIAVVSNHVPQEVHDAIEMLNKENIQTDIYGLGYRVTMVNSDLLQKYDAVITIGKTVQYCMSLCIPVYCYDIHGGPGWIDCGILDKAFQLNFSGRGFSKKTGDEIAEEIRHLPQNTGDLQQFIKKNCVLEDLLSELLMDLPNIAREKLYRYAKRQSRINKNTVSLYRSRLDLEMRLISERETKTKLLAEMDKKQKELLYENQERTEKLLAEKDREMRGILVENQKRTEELLAEKDREMQKVLAENQEKAKEVLAVRDRQIEQLESDRQIANECFQQKLNDLQIIIDRQNAELDQKEANCRYLIELGAEKDKTINDIYSSKAWQVISFVRKVKNKIKRSFKKLFRIFKRANSASVFCNKQIVESHSTTIQPQFPLVTVGIPVYDRTDFLIQSLDSILNQTYSNIEIIVVCDGSPKETLEIVRDYEKKKKIRAFYYSDNSGNAVRGRNKAIREARGEFFAFQDSDDIAMPNRIELSVACMNKYGVDVVYGGWKALVDGTRKIDIKNGQEVFSPDCDIEALKKICVPCQSTVMARTAALRHVGGLNTKMRYREDHELWLRLAYRGYRFKAIQEVLTNLRLHENNLELSFKETDDKWLNLMQAEYKRVFQMKPKVAYLIPGCGISGGIAVICQHLNRLKKRGYDVLMISETEETEIPWFPNQDVDIVSMKDAPDNIDYLVATGWSTAYSIQNIPAKRKCYFVQSDETRFNPPDTKAHKMAFDSYKMELIYITEAKWIKRWLKEKFGQNAFYVPNGLDTDIIHSTGMRNTDPNRKIRVLLEGPIDIPYKGMQYAFAAVEGLDCEVWCISSAGVPKPGWRCDKFFSRVPMDQMKYMYSNCDILLKMSQVEGFFGPPMEMMACHGVCVVGKVTGYDEYIVDNYNALVVESGDVEGAHNAVKRLIEDKELRERLAENGYKTAMQWKWDDSIDLLEQVFPPVG